MAMPLPHGLMTLDEFSVLPEDHSACFELQEGYEESRTATGELLVTEPFALRVDIDALVARRAR